MQKQFIAKSLYLFFWLTFKTNTEGYGAILFPVPRENIKSLLNNNDTK